MMMDHFHFPSFGERPAVAPRPKFNQLWTVSQNFGSLADNTRMKRPAGSQEPAYDTISTMNSGSRSPVLSLPISKPNSLVSH